LCTPEVLERIHTVIRDTATPSWLGSVPSNFGEASAGTIKADEWRSMAGVYLPLALVSLWGEGSLHPSQKNSSKLRAILDHTMMLFSATRLACLRTVTPARLSAYRECIQQYVRNLSRLHPGIGYRPIHHMAQHLDDFLILFGPVQSWWCFPFERLIGILQRIPNNHKIGEHFQL